MKIAISNLAWEVNEDEQILPLLIKYKVDGVEIALSKVWQNPIKTDAIKLKKYKQFWSKNGFPIIATASLLFGHPELTIFKNRQTREKTFSYLSKMIEISAYLGAKVMVFGSPKNRKTNNLDKEEVSKIAQDFFFSIGEAAKKHDIYFGIEPNPVYYGTDFINTTMEALELIKKVDHPNFRLHLDSGTMAMNGENYQDTIRISLPYVCHFHISEPMLKPVKAGLVDHEVIAATLKLLKYDKWISVEMPLANNLPYKSIIEETLQFVTKIYG